MTMLLKLVKASGSLVMINFYSAYISQRAQQELDAYYEYRAELRRQKLSDKDIETKSASYQKTNNIFRATVRDVVDHIDHVVKVAGVDHVGLGSDFDGVPTLPQGLDDVSKFPNITSELLKRGYQSADIKKILGGNFYRVLSQAEKLRKTD